MKHPVTWTSLNNTRKALGCEWKSKAQAVTAREVADHRFVCLQAYRREGKSWLADLVGANYITFGGGVIIGAPTLLQSTRILFRNTKAKADAIFKYAGGLRKDPDTKTEVLWEHGASLLALSARDVGDARPTGGAKPQEGYGGDLLLLDEGHRMPESVIGVFRPMLDDAVAEGVARVIILGVGGHRSSAIETMKERGYTEVFMPASRAVRLDPELVPIFERAQQELSDWQYRQHYECLPATEGMRFMFPDPIPELVDIQEWLQHGLAPVLYFGIDVGQIIDSTVLKVISVVSGAKGPIINEIDTYELAGIPYPAQARALYEYIDKRYPWRPENIIVELTGVGRGLYDDLNETPFRCVRGMDTTGLLKDQFWHQMNKMIREGRFGCKRQESRVHYEGMMYEYVKSKGGFKMEFEHSDYWMALCMAFAGLSEIEAF